MPRCNYTLDVPIERLHRVHIQIITAERMRLEVEKAFADLAVASQSFPPFDLVHWRMNTHPENIERRQQHLQIIGPALAFHNMFHEQVQADLSERRYRFVKSLKEFFSPLRPNTFIRRPKICIGKLIGGIIMKLRFKA